MDNCMGMSVGGDPIGERCCALATRLILLLLFLSKGAESINFGNPELLREDISITQIRNQKHSPNRLLMATRTRILELDLNNNLYRIIAGHHNDSGYREGYSLSARFTSLNDLISINRSTLIVTDLGCIRNIINKTTSSLAGKIGEMGNSDGPVAGARFGVYLTILLAEHLLYIGDVGNSAIRTLNMISNNVETLKTYENSNANAIPLTMICITQPNCDSIMVLFEHGVSKVNRRTGETSILVGGTVSDNTTGSLDRTRFRQPMDITLLSPQLLVVADHQNRRIVLIDFYRNVSENIFSFQVISVTCQGSDLFLVRSEGLYRVPLVNDSGEFSCSDQTPENLAWITTNNTASPMATTNFTTASTTTDSIARTTLAINTMNTTTQTNIAANSGMAVNATAATSSETMMPISTERSILKQALTIIFLLAFCLPLLVLIIFIIPIWKSGKCRRVLNVANPQIESVGRSTKSSKTPPIKLHFRSQM